MDFMTSTRLNETYPCAYYINGKRVCIEIYEHFESMVRMFGKFDCLHTTTTKTTRQFRKCGSI